MVALLKADKDEYYMIQAVAEFGEKCVLASFPTAKIKNCQKRKKLRNAMYLKSCRVRV